MAYTALICPQENNSLVWPDPLEPPLAPAESEKSDCETLKSVLRVAPAELLACLLHNQKV